MASTQSEQVPEQVQQVSENQQLDDATVKPSSHVDKVKNVTSQNLTDDAKLTIDSDSEKTPVAQLTDIKEITSEFDAAKAVVMECLSAAAHTDDAEIAKEGLKKIDSCPYKDVGDLARDLDLDYADDVDDDDVMCFVNQAIANALKICAEDTTGFNDVTILSKNQLPLKEATDGPVEVLEKNAEKFDESVITLPNNNQLSSTATSSSNEQASSMEHLNPTKHNPSVSPDATADELPVNDIKTPDQELKIYTGAGTDIGVTACRREVRTHPQIYQELPDTDDEQWGQKIDEETAIVTNGDSVSNPTSAVCIQIKHESTAEKDPVDDVETPFKPTKESKTHPSQLSQLVSGADTEVHGSSPTVDVEFSHTADDSNVSPATLSPDSPPADPAMRPSAAVVDKTDLEQPASVNPSPAGDMERLMDDPREDHQPSVDSKGEAASTTGKYEMKPDEPAVDHNKEIVQPSVLKKPEPASDKGTVPSPSEVDTTHLAYAPPTEICVGTTSTPDVVPDIKNVESCNANQQKHFDPAMIRQTAQPTTKEPSDIAAPESGLALVNDRLRIKISELQTQIKQLCCELAFVGDRNWRLEAYTDCLIYTLEKMGVTEVEDLDQTTLPLGLFKVKVKAGYRLAPYNGLPQRSRRSYQREGRTPPTIDLSGGSLANTLAGNSRRSGNLPFNISATDDVGLSVQQMHQYESKIETLAMQNHFLQTQLQQATCAPQVSIHNDMYNSRISPDFDVGGITPPLSTGTVYYPTPTVQSPPSDATMQGPNYGMLPTASQTTAPPGLSTTVPLPTPTVHYSMWENVSSGDSGKQDVVTAAPATAQPTDKGYSAYSKPKSEYELPPRFLSNVRKDYINHSRDGRRSYNSGYTYDTKYKNDDRGYDTTGTSSRGPRVISSTELGSSVRWGRNGSGGTGRPQYQRYQGGPKRSSSHVN